MLGKWRHPVTVATFSVTDGTIRHTHRITEILRIKCSYSKRVAARNACCYNYSIHSAPGPQQG
eukprot:6185435-Pleurochrysis_carterae.AAC.2